MAVEKLSPAQIRQASKPGTYGDGGGLYLRVAKGGSKQWVFRFKRGGKQRDMGLGSAATFTLAEAREAARGCRKLLYAGGDPIEERRQRQERVRLERAKAMSFAQCAAAYVAVHEVAWKNRKHREQWRNTLRDYVNPLIGGFSVAAIDTALILRVLQAIWTEKTVTAMRVRGRIERILSWASTRGLRAAGDNPARWKGHLENLLPPPRKITRVEHLAALPYPELPSLVNKLRARRSECPRAPVSDSHLR
jgi:hypothetical protein